MKDVSNEYHGYLCSCSDCTPRVPADKTIGYYTRRFEVALTCLIIFGATLFIACH